MNATSTVSYGRLINPSTNDLKLMGLSRQIAFESLYGTYLDRIHDYIASRVANGGLVEDITAQVFLEAWEQLPSFQTGKLHG